MNNKFVLLVLLTMLIPWRFSNANVPKVLNFTYAQTNAQTNSQSSGQLNNQSSAQTNGKLHVMVQGAKNNKGKIVLALFNNKEEFTKKPYKEVVINADDAANGYTFIDLVYGDYAVVIFHDENANKNLDRGFLGVPEEGVAFSNNLPVKFSLPTFAEAKVLLQGHNEIVIKLNYLN